MVSFEEKKTFLDYEDVQFFLFFSFVACAFGILSKKLLSNPRSQKFTTFFS